MDLLVVARVVEISQAFQIGEVHIHPNFEASIMTVLIGLFYRIRQIARLRFTSNLTNVDDFFSTFE